MRKAVIDLCVRSSLKPALKYCPPNQGEKEDCESLDRVCHNTAYEYEATEDAENDGVEGPCPVRPIETIFATTKDKYSESS